MNIDYKLCSALLFLFPNEQFGCTADTCRLEILTNSIGMEVDMGVGLVYHRRGLN